MSKGTCACIEKVKTKIKTEADLEKYIGECMAKQPAATLAALQKELKIKVLDDANAEKLGEAVGRKMGTTCQTFISLITSFAKIGNAENKEAELMDTNLVTPVLDSAVIDFCNCLTKNKDSINNILSGGEFIEKCQAIAVANRRKTLSEELNISETDLFEKDLISDKFIEKLMFSCNYFSETLLPILTKAVEQKSAKNTALDLSANQICNCIKTTKDKDIKKVVNDCTIKYSMNNIIALKKQLKLTENTTETGKKIGEALTLKLINEINKL